MNESDKLKNGIQSRRQVLDKLESEQANVTFDSQKADEINQSLKSQIEQISVPSVCIEINLFLSHYAMQYNTLSSN